MWVECGRGLLRSMAREGRDAAAGAATPQAVTKRRPRYRRGGRRKAEEPHPYADPSRPLPNLAAADRFESYYWAPLGEGLVAGLFLLFEDAEQNLFAQGIGAWTTKKILIWMFFDMRYI